MIDGIVISVVGGLLLKGGSRAIDHFFDEVIKGKQPVLDQTGIVASTRLGTDQHQYVTSNAVRAQRRRTVTIGGRLFFPDELSQLVSDGDIVLALVLDVHFDRLALFQADPDVEFLLTLEPGSYLFYMFVLAPDADDIYASSIDGVGFPSAIDLSSIDNILLDNYEDVGALIDDRPIDLPPGGPYQQDFVVLDALDLEDVPDTLDQLLFGATHTTGGTLGFLTGEWHMEETYDYSDTEFGDRVATVYLMHAGNHVDGLVMMRDVSSEGEESIAYQSITGMVFGRDVKLDGTEVRIVSGASQGWYLDHWFGKLTPNGQIVGESEDDAGTPGEFVMTRVT